MDTTNRNLIDDYVAQQVVNLKTVTTKHLESMFENFSPDDIANNSSFNSDEIVDSLRLSLITESLTEQYSETFQIGAKKYDAGWLHKYIVEFWEPDELGHADPFKNILLDFGIDQTELDLQIDEAKSQTHYSLNHDSGIDPISLTTYGMIQECITDYWYELQRGFFPRGSNTSKVLALVKGREALHTVQFRDLTAFQLESDPALLANISNSVVHFQMPANHIPVVRDIEAKTKEWIPKMDGSVYELLRRIIRHVTGALGDKDTLGSIILNYASYSDKRFFGLLPNSVIAKAVRHIRGGYGIVGEIVLEKLGLIANDLGTPKSLFQSIIYRIKRVLKEWAKRRIELEGFLINKETNKVDGVSP